MAGATVGDGLGGIFFIVGRIAVATDQHLPNLGLEARADMGDEWFALPHDKTFVPITDAPSGAAGEYEARNIVSRHHNVNREPCFYLWVVLACCWLCDNYPFTVTVQRSVGYGVARYLGTDMTGILAIETATDACSVAVSIGGQLRERHEIAPRQHSQLLFVMLEELLPGGDLTGAGIEVIAYGSGPGSFTGLRIAASAVQGIAYSCGLPAVAVSTLAVLAQTALRRGEVDAADTVFCSIDARINEVFSAVYTFEDKRAILRDGPWACAPADLAPALPGELCAVGSGCQFAEQFPQALRARIRLCAPGLLPAAQDMIPLALARFRSGDIQTARQVQPVYVRDEIAWKKLAEQGRPNGQR
jgi:tRNA threonylcarbamoyladenosine biosynthesis protein TsaB